MFVSLDVEQTERSNGERDGCSLTCWDGDLDDQEEKRKGMEMGGSKVGEQELTAEVAFYSRNS